MEQWKTKFVLIYPSRSNPASSRDEVPGEIKALRIFHVGPDWMDSNHIFLVLFFSVKLFDFEVIDEPVWLLIY